MHISKKILIEFLVILIVINFIIILIVKRYVYFKPGSRTMAEPFKELNITKNPFDLQHVWIAQATPRNGNSKAPLIVYCQDRFENMSINQSRIKSFYDSGFSIVMFNYPGYGNRKGVPSQDEFFSTTRKLLVDLNRAGYDLKNGDISLYGDGIGCAVALDSAIRFQIPYIIITNYVSCIRTQLSNILFPIKFWFGEFDSDSKLENFFNTIIVMDKSIIPTRHLYIPDTDKIFEKICNKTI